MDKSFVENHFRGDFQGFYSHYLPKIQAATGDEMKALCCFHEDSTPSLSLNRRTGLFKCFGCGTSGDIFTFYAKTHDMTLPADFSEALAGIAEDFHIGNGNGNGGKLTVTARYDYVDEAGNLPFQIERLEPKSFRIRRRDGTRWIYNAQGVKIILYNLPEVFMKEIDSKKEMIKKYRQAVKDNKALNAEWQHDYDQQYGKIAKPKFTVIKGGLANA